MLQNIRSFRGYVGGSEVPVGRMDLRTKETGGTVANPVSLVRLLGKREIVQRQFGVNEPGGT